MRHELGLQGEQCKGSENQNKGRESRGQQVQGEDRQQNKDHAHGSGNHRARVVEFRVQRERPDSQQDERNIRVHHVGQNALFQGKVIASDRLPNQIQRCGFSIEAFETLALKILKQLLFTRRNVIDKLLRERLLIRKRFRLPHRALRHLNVAAALRDDRAHQGGRVILDFLFHNIIHLAASDGDRMSRTRIRPRRHRRDVGAFEDEKSRRRRPAAARSDINNDRYWRCHNLLDDLTRRIQQPARRVQLDQHRLIFISIRFRQRPPNVLIGNGMNGVVDHDLQHFRRGSRGHEQNQPNQRTKQMRNSHRNWQRRRFLRQLLAAVTYRFYCLANPA